MAYSFSTRLALVLTFQSSLSVCTCYSLLIDVRLFKTLYALAVLYIGDVLMMCM